MCSSKRSNLLSVVRHVTKVRVVNASRGRITPACADHRCRIGFSMTAKPVSLPHRVACARHRAAEDLQQLQILLILVVNNEHCCKAMTQNAVEVAQKL